MSGSWPPYLDPLLVQANGAGGDPPALLLVRHSIREPIAGASMSAAIQAPLTDEGRELAREFGRRLEPRRPLRLVTSPVLRCVDTAECLAEAFRARGGRTESAGTRRYLGAPYLRDVTRAIDALGDDGIVGWVRGWAREEIDPAVAQPPREAGSELLAELWRERAAAPPGSLDLLVTHDLTVLALLSLAFDVGEEGFPWPEFLDGVAVTGTPSASTIAFRGWVRRLPAAASPRGD